MMASDATYADGQTPQVGDVVECVERMGCLMLNRNYHVLQIFKRGHASFIEDIRGRFDLSKLRLVRRANKPTGKDTTDAH
jgi:hypothetical protein